MGLAGLLEALVTTDQFRITAGDDIALAEQRPTGGFTGLRISHRIVTGKRTGVGEVLMLVDGGFFDEHPAATASTSASPATRMGNDLNIEHPEEIGSGRIVQQIDA